MTQLLAGVGDWTGARSSAVPEKISHPYFRRELRNALRRATPAFGSSLPASKGSNPAARRGLRFEAKVTGALAAAYGSRFISQLPFFFEEEMGADLRPGQRGKAVLDGLLFSPDWRAACLIEIKLRHSGDAWWQLNRFYRPIVDRAFGGAFELHHLEIVQNYDPRVRLPNPQSVLLDLDEVWGLRPHFHPVLIRDKNGR